MARCHCELLKIPPRSPDLNPIENIFNIVSRKLEKDALGGAITRESYAESVIECKEQSMSLFLRR